MGDTITAPADAGTQGTITPSSTPTTAPAEAGEPTTLEGWKERALKEEAIKKGLIAQRDALKAQSRDPKAVYLETEEGKELLTRAAKAAEYEKAQAEAERKAAEERGEYKQLLEKERAEWTAKITDYDAKLKSALDQHAELARKHKADRARAALTEAYQAAGGIDVDAFVTLAASHLTDGSIAVGDDGTVQGHGDVVKAFVEKRGYLFRNTAADALEHLRKHGVQVGALPGTIDERKAQTAQTKQPASLAELAASERAKRMTKQQSRWPGMPPKQTG